VEWIASGPLSGAGWCRAASTWRSIGRSAPGLSTALRGARPEEDATFKAPAKAYGSALVDQRLYWATCASRARASSAMAS